MPAVGFTIVTVRNACAPALIESAAGAVVQRNTDGGDAGGVAGGGTTGAAGSGAAAETGVSGATGATGGGATGVGCTTFGAGETSAARWSGVGAFAIAGAALRSDCAWRDARRRAGATRS